MDVRSDPQAGGQTQSYVEGEAEGVFVIRSLTDLSCFRAVIIKINIGDC